MRPFSRFNVFGVSSDGIAMSLSCQFEFILMSHPVLRGKDKRFLLADHLLSLIVDAVLEAVLGEISLAVAHRLEHIFMYYLTPP